MRGHWLIAPVASDGDEEKHFASQEAVMEKTWRRPNHTQEGAVNSAKFPFKTPLSPQNNIVSGIRKNTEDGANGEGLPLKTPLRARNQVVSRIRKNA